MDSASARRNTVSYWYVVAAACVIPAALSLGENYAEAVLDGDVVRWRVLFWNSAEWLMLGGLTPLAFVLGSRWPLLKQHFLRNLGIHILGALSLCVCWAAGGALLRVALDMPLGRGNPPFGHYLADWTLTSLPWSFFMYFAVLGCVHAFRFFLEVRDERAHAAVLSAQLATARLAALRAQLQPHFLFNSLNSVTVLLRDKQNDRAEHMLDLLSGVLRDVLRTDASKTTTVAAELAFTRRCLDIEQVRFSDRLQVHYDVAPNTLDATVPEFILQPVVENALRHGVAKRLAGGRIEISARRAGDDLVMKVRDDGPGFAALSGSAGVGLANTRGRLEALYGDRASLSWHNLEPGAEVSITIPFNNFATGIA